tara:strand:- start:24838 stop:25032 length:195 start_codon:yes stop_codon:yes gene_type:complete
MLKIFLIELIFIDLKQAIYPKQKNASYKIREALKIILHQYSEDKITIRYIVKVIGFIDFKRRNF